MMSTNLKRLWIKLRALFERALQAIFFLPLRLWRLMKHVAAGLKGLFAQGKGKIGPWWLDFAFLLMDVLALPEVYETVFDFIKWNTRPLSPQERQLAASVFGDALRLDAIRLDNRARLGCKKRKIVYVSFFTVNSWGPIRPDTFVHELVHVWQYQQMGGCYIPRALRAQRTEPGYNYGGPSALATAKQGGTKFTDFNLEQQADIVGDYYAIREGLRPTWGKGTPTDLPVYQHFLSEVRV